MTEGEALYQQILAEPQADDLRMILADWIDEHGQPERAEFVRVQIELARLLATPCSARCDMPWNENLGGGMCLKCAQVDRLSRREQELWDSSDKPGGWKLRGVLPRPKTYSFWNHALRCDSKFERTDAAVYRRGFIDEIGAPLDSLEEYLPAIVQMHPVTRVVATDKEPAPHPGGDLWSWYPPAATQPPLAPDELPDDVFDALHGFRHRDDVELEKLYHSRQAALDALSDAILRRARPSPSAPAPFPSP